MVSFASFVTLALAITLPAAAFPTYGSLAGLSREALEEIIPNLEYKRAADPPPPIAYNGTKLVHDARHPYRPPGPNDMRGPCPGLNTLANHGYLPHNGIASPEQLIWAVQEGFNMEYLTAINIVYSSLLVDGNVITNLLSIGGKSRLTGPDPPAPATAAGLNTHGPIEGDASTTRGDAYFGDNHNFNETLFQEFVDLSNQYGAGKYNATVGGELRYRRVQDSIATNPVFSFVPPRYIAGFAEMVFPLNFWVDGRRGDGQLDVDVARGFYQHGRMPDDFHRASKPMSVEGIDIVLAVHDIAPGRNINGVNTYTPDPNAVAFLNDPTGCNAYVDFVNNAVVGLYPNPTGVLRRAINRNLDLYYLHTGGKCTQVFPYGRD
ncbi:heme-thiolate peroxidase [Leucocoprinus birnbaumii]|uniref:Heme-thiolate peroxidase n=1 Tax=Leucocoprinus birnbaumii TaxID=56174 RepID=A0AAD5VWH8_9AGAR|nr:heme-thiolate peroxidase [Leucocoprinus birnbaumii]